jgi:hypothetical protein
LFYYPSLFIRIPVSAHLSLGQNNCDFNSLEMLFHFYKQIL